MMEVEGEGVVVVATCALSQWALDFQGNLGRILESIQMAKAAGATYRCGTELDVTGYSCGDHYHESDTQLHAWQVVGQLLQHPSCRDILIDIGLPVTHRDVIYNCKLVFFNRKILLIRPKMILADDGHMGYSETRWFTPWKKVREVEEHVLPSFISEITGQTHVSFGDAVVATRDTCVGYEICEELWNPENPHIAQYLDGVDIISNGSTSTQELGGPQVAYDMVSSATKRSGGCYLYANQRGCDGSQGYCPGDSCIGLNGDIVAATTPYTLTEVEVVTASFPLSAVRRYKGLIRSRCHHAAKSKSYPRVKVDFSLSNNGSKFVSIPSCHPVKIPTPSLEEQILMGPACWLWDFLRRSGRAGLLLPLTGEVDSSASAAIVVSMCHLVVNAITQGDDKVLSDVRRLTGESDYVPRASQELCGRLVHTIHASSGTVSHSATDTTKALAQQMGCQHHPVALDSAVSEMLKLLSSFGIAAPKPRAEGSSHLKEANEKDAQHFLHSRLCMTFAHLFAQSKTNTKEGPSELLVIGSSNTDNHFRGSSAVLETDLGDLNLIARYPRNLLIKLLLLAKDRLNLPVLGEVVRTSLMDKDEAEKHQEMSTCRELQILEGCGPYSMFRRVSYLWADKYSMHEKGEKVKRFFREYNRRRLRMMVTAPCCYMPGQGPPDDQRPLIYSQLWDFPFNAIDRAIKAQENKETK